MKIIILVLAILAFIGCKEEAPTENKLITQQKYTIEELENDTNWVEITDIDTLELPCIWLDLFKRGKLIRQESEYNDMYDESKALMDHSELPYCKDDTNYINVDFLTRSLVLFEVRSNGGSPTFNRRIFKNSSLKEYRYILELTIRSGSKENSGFTEVISIPKVNEDYEFKFDTLDVKD